jgi:hypothetical protein
MKQFGIILLLIIIIFKGYAQNLIANPSFEIYDTCPFGFGDFDKLDDWFTPSNNSSESFNECFSTDYLNYFEYKEASNGTSFVGLSFVTYDFSSSELVQSFEYIGGTLNQELEIGEKYCFTIDISTSRKVKYLVKNLNIAFDSDSLFSNYPNLIAPDIVFDISNDYLIDSLKWKSLDYKFTATGTERYIYIGFLDTITDLIFIDAHPDSVFGVYHNAYYFIDNVTLTKCLPPLEYDFVIYPNPSNGGVIYTEFDADTTGVIELYNSLGQIVRSRDITQGNFKGELFQQLASGVYIVTIQTDSGYRREQKLVVTK